MRRFTLLPSKREDIGLATMINILLPCYNEESGLEELITRVSQACQNLSYRVVAVDDGSNDETYSLLCRLKEVYPVTALKHEKNKGIHEAIRTLLLWVHDQTDISNYVITMDSDLTHHPKYIPILLSACEKEDAQVAIASRYIKRGRQIGVPFYRTLLSRLLCAYVKTRLEMPIKDVSSGYRCIKTEKVNEIIDVYGREMFIESKGFEVQLELLYKLFVSGAKIVEIPFTLDYTFKKGRSKMKIYRTILGYLQAVSRLSSLR